LEHLSPGAASRDEPGGAGDDSTRSSHAPRAERLDVCRATVYGMVERGELPAVRIGAMVRIDPGDLKALVPRRRE
jgi:excisionase family DNA binding protein